jgi:hypothetical protein
VVELVVRFVIIELVVVLAINWALLDVELMIVGTILDEVDDVDEIEVLNEVAVLKKVLVVFVLSKVIVEVEEVNKANVVFKVVFIDDIKLVVTVLNVLLIFKLVVPTTVEIIVVSIEGLFVIYVVAKDFDIKTLVYIVEFRLNGFDVLRALHVKTLNSESFISLSTKLSIKAEVQIEVFRHSL